MPTIDFSKPYTPNKNIVPCLIKVGEDENGKPLVVETVMLKTQVEYSVTAEEIEAATKEPKDEK